MPINYNSIDEIFNAGTSNMTVIRNNSRKDEVTDIITGVDWFTYNGVVADAIYVNSNSWIGFGSESEHLLVNRRDASINYLYREEGTLWDYYKFLKIRWQGYSESFSTPSSYMLTYDVILWETGDISLHMIQIPSARNDGSYSLKAINAFSYSYTVNSSSVDVTFKKTDNGFDVINNIVELPSTPKCIIRSGSTYYSYADNTLEEIQVAELTAEIFSIYGTAKSPSVDLIMSLDSPEILCWSHTEDFAPFLAIHTNQVFPQAVYSEVQIIPEGSIIDKAEIFCYNDNNSLISITFDGGQTWKYFNGLNWITATSEVEGMTAEAIKYITADQWADAGVYTTIQFRCAVLTKDSKIGRIHFNLSQMPAQE